jgi:hypothetical protein
MKKTIIYTLAFIATFGMFFVSCQKDESTKHKYTQEELDEIARQDSLKKIIPADIVFAQNVTVPINKGYEGITVSLVAPADTVKLLDSLGFANTRELVAALGTLDAGVQSGNDITWFAYNYSTKYEVNSASTTNYFGHWFDANGDVCSWGDQAMLFCEKQNEVDLLCTMGIFPDHSVIGDVFHIVEAIKYDNIKVAFVFNVTIGAKEAPPVTTVVGTQTIAFEAEATSGWSDYTNDLDTVAILNAIGIKPQAAKIFGINHDASLYGDGLTANNGCFFTRAGNVCAYGAGNIAMYVEYRPVERQIGAGQYPDSCVVGNTYTGRLAFVNMANLKQYTVVVNMTITPSTVEYPETTLETTLNLALTQPAWIDWITGTELSLDSAAIQAAIGCGPSAAILYGVNATTDSLYIKGKTATFGYFFNATGDVCQYGDAGASIYVEYYPGTQKIGVGQYPARCTAGIYNGRLAFVNGTKRAEVKVALTVQ